MTMMTNGPTGRAIRRLHSAALARGIEMTDGQLLESFVSRTDEAAFEALVLRHGPMVLGVCRRILGDSHDAEDAFQAVFLVLVRKAASIVPRELVANWLYGVAFRTANKARVMNATRRAREMHVRERPAPADAHHELFWRELLPLLDSELQALPDKYRAPIVLCDLEGKQRKEAARQLGWPEGTLSSRLAAGRKMLARRLGRRGVSLALGAAPLLVAQVAEAVPPALLATTVQAGILAAGGHAIAAVGVSATVAALADGVVKAMLLAKLKLAVAVVFALAVAGASMSLFAGRQTNQPPNAETTPLRAGAVDRPLPPSQTETAHASAPIPLPAHAEKHAGDIEIGQIWVLHGEEFVVVGRSSTGPAKSSTSAGHALPGIAVRLGVACLSEGDCFVDMADCSGPPRVMSGKVIAVRPAKSGTKQGPGVWKIVVVQGQREGVCEYGGIITVLPGMIRINVPPTPPKNTTVIRPKGMIG